MKATIYISRKVLNFQDIIDWAKEAGFKTMMPVDSLHVTVVYCKKKVDWGTVKRDQPEMVLVPAADRELQNFDGGACVLEIKSDELLERNEALRKLGIHSKFPDYRAHITITYDKPKGMKTEDIIAYDGPIILGPEVIEEASTGWQKEYEEIDLATVTAEKLDERHISDLDSDQVYGIFKSSYEASTGQAWDRDKFFRRAANWTFYGDDAGFVAFREQASGMRKLVAVAGETKGIVIGLKQLSDEGKPTWGAVSGKMVAAAKRYGFIAPHTYIGGPTAIKMLMKMIPTNVFGGVEPVVTSDGALNLSYDDMGEQKKYFIANRAYFKSLITNPMFKDNVKSSILVKFIEGLIK